MLCERRLRLRSGHLREGALDRGRCGCCCLRRRSSRALRKLRLGDVVGRRLLERRRRHELLDGVDRHAESTAVRRKRDAFTACALRREGSDIGKDPLNCECITGAAAAQSRSAAAFAAITIP